MKLKNLLMLAAAAAGSVFGAEILRNGEFQERPDLTAYWSVAPAGAVTSVPGEGDKKAVSVDLSACKGFSQSGILLVPGERYRIGGVIRTENFKTSREKGAFLIHNKNWEKELKTGGFPENTNGKWVTVERIGIVPASRDGLYTFAVYLPGASGKLEIAKTYIIPISDKAKAGSRAVSTYKTDNLLENAVFKGQSGEVDIWEVPGFIEGGVEILAGQGPEGQNALKLDLKVCKQFIQSDLKLVAGETYCLGGWVRTKDFHYPANRPAAFYVHNSNWSKDVKTPFFPADTKGKWVRLERIFTAMPSPAGTYTFTVWGPDASGSLEIANPYLIPLSAKARLAVSGE